MSENIDDATRAAVEEAEWMAAQRREADARCIIAVGDVVVLRSGGPEMTVEGVGRIELSVAWFDKDTVARASFPLACVRKVK